MKCVMFIVMLLCRAPALMTQPAADSAVSTNSPPAPEFRRSDRPLGFKLGFATMSPYSSLGAQVDMIFFNRLGLEAATTIAANSVRARFYLLEGATSPFVGLGTGMAYNRDGLWSASWREWHLGFERAFANGIVLQLQFLGFFDRRGYAGTHYTFAPGIGYRL